METTHEEIWAMLRELIAAQQETDRRFKETDKKFQDTERLFKQQSQETDRKIKSVATQLGQLGNRLGQFVEEMVRPALVRLFRERNIDVRQVLQNLSAHDAQGKIVTQIDLLVLNTDVAIVVECKSQPSIDDVNEHLGRLDIFKTHFPQYAQLRIFGAIAAMVLPQHISEYAMRKGLYSLAQSGDAMAIHNEKLFVPKQW